MKKIPLFVVVALSVIVGIGGAVPLFGVVKSAVGGTVEVAATTTTTSTSTEVTFSSAFSSNLGDDGGGGDDEDDADFDTFPPVLVRVPENYLEGGQNYVPSETEENSDCSPVDGDTFRYLCDRPGWNTTVKLLEFPDRTEYLGLNDTGLGRFPASSFAGKEVLFLEINNHRGNFSLDYDVFSGLLQTQVLHIQGNDWWSVQDDPGGYFLSTFRHLENLTQLVLESNALTLEGVDANKTSEEVILPNLKFLSLSRNRLGRIEDSFFHPLRNSPLSELNLNHAGLESIGKSAFSHLPNLRHVDFYGNKLLVSHYGYVSYVAGLSGVLDPFEFYGGLKNLGLGSTNMTNFPRGLLEPLSNGLVRLNMAGNEIINLGNKGAGTPKGVLPNMTSLQEVILKNNKIEEVNELTFANVPNLKVLDLSGNKIAQIYKGMMVPSLEKLDISMQCSGFEAFLENCPKSFTITPNIFQNMTSLSSLNMGNVLLQYLNNSHFNGLENLEELWLDHTDLLRIEDRALAPMSNLRRLYLNNNENLVGLMDSTFVGMTSLEVLDLAYSSKAFSSLFNSGATNRDGGLAALLKSLQNLTALNMKSTLGNNCGNQNPCSLDPDLLSSLPMLEYLDLSENFLKSWEDDRFDSTPKLKILLLESNSMDFITEPLLDTFRTLEELDMTGNPFYCNDQVTAFHEMTMEEDIDVVNYDGGDGYFCTNEENEEISFRTWSEEQWKQDRRKILFGALMGVLAVVLVVIAYVLYRNRFYLSYRFISAKKRLNRVDKNAVGAGGEKAGGEYDYDVFVCYSKEARHWVLEEFVPELESGGEPKIKACVHERDFEVSICFIFVSLF